MEIIVPGRIIVDKVTRNSDGTPVPGDPTEFDFTISGPDANVTPPVDFTLYDAQTPYESPGLDRNLGANDRVYTVTEAPEAGWALASATCTSDQRAGTTFNPQSLRLRNGETFTCTFINQKNPTSTTIVMFDAQSTNSSIDLFWMTLSEETTDYFNLYRSTTPEELGTMINDEPIITQNSGLPMGASYTFSDTEVVSGVQHFYTLEVWDFDGTSELNGPTMGTLNPPTAITLGMLTGDSSATPMAALLAVGALLALGTLVVRRRAR